VPRVAGPPVPRARLLPVPIARPTRRVSNPSMRVRPQVEVEAAMKLDDHLNRGLDACWGEDQDESEPDYEQMAEDRAMRRFHDREVW
jgi:hypothetical protein